MNIYKFFSILSGIIFTLAFVPYIKAIVQKKTKPEKASWIIWASLDTMAFAAMAVKGTINGQIASAIVCSWIVVVVTMIYGKRGWKKTDKICLASALLGAVLWLFSKDAIFGIIASQAAIFIGSIPTFQHAHKNPEEEDKLAWFLYWLSCLPAVFATSQQMTFESLAQPINFLVIESVMVYLLFIKRRSRMNKNNTGRAIWSGGKIGITFTVWFFSSMIVLPLHRSLALLFNVPESGLLKTLWFGGGGALWFLVLYLLISLFFSHKRKKLFM